MPKKNRKPTGLEITLTTFDYHRNGISGEGFYVAVFTMTDAYVIEQPMVAVLFRDPACCCVLSRARIAEGEISDRYRGDNFSAELRKQISARLGQDLFA